MQLSKLGRVGIIATVAVAVVGLGIYAYKRSVAKKAVVDVEPVVEASTSTTVDTAVEKTEEVAINVEFICTGTCAITDAAGEHLTSLRIVADTEAECMQMVSDVLQGTTLIVHGDTDEIESAASTLRSAAIAVTERIVTPGNYKRQIFLSCDALTVMVSNPHVVKE